MAFCPASNVSLVDRLPNYDSAVACTLYEARG